ncbi:MAG: hypothetical protein ACM3ZU_01050 [Bacteroidota bacterium]
MGADAGRRTWGRTCTQAWMETWRWTWRRHRRAWLPSIVAALLLLATLMPPFAAGAGAGAEDSVDGAGGLGCSDGGDGGSGGGCDDGGVSRGDDDGGGGDRLVVQGGRVTLRPGPVETHIRVTL